MRKRIITIISIVLISIALTCSLLIDSLAGSKISNIITVITAILGAVALFVQFKKDKRINEAGFILNFSIHFYQIYACKDILNELENCRQDENYKLDVEKWYKDIVSYLEWCESLAAMVNNKVLSIDKIDDMLSYRFFIIVNNKQIQDCEIIPARMFYRGIYKLYKTWSKFKKDKKLDIIFEETELSKTEGYNEIANSKY